MQIAIAYSEPSQQVSLKIDVPDGTTVEGVVERSGILRLFPHINLAAQKVGIFARVVRLDTVVRPGDRVEIYRPITCDPKAARKRAGADEPTATETAAG